MRANMRAPSKSANWLSALQHFKPSKLLKIQECLVKNSETTKKQSKNQKCFAALKKNNWWLLCGSNFLVVVGASVAVPHHRRPFPSNQSKVIICCWMIDYKSSNPSGNTDCHVRFENNQEDLRRKSNNGSQPKRTKTDLDHVDAITVRLREQALVEGTVNTQSQYVRGINYRCSPKWKRQRRFIKTKTGTELIREISSTLRALPFSFPCKYWYQIRYDWLHSESEWRIWKA